MHFEASLNSVRLPVSQSHGSLTKPVMDVATSPFDPEGVLLISKLGC